MCSEWFRNNMEILCAPSLNNDDTGVWLCCQGTHIYICGRGDVTSAGRRRSARDLNGTQLPNVLPTAGFGNDVQLALCLSSMPQRRLGAWMYDTISRNLVTRWRRQISFALSTFDSIMRNPERHLNRRLDGPRRKFQLSNRRLNPSVFNYFGCCISNSWFMTLSCHCTYCILHGAESFLRS